jgi:hypothetical protein
MLNTTREEKLARFERLSKREGIMTGTEFALEYLRRLYRCWPDSYFSDSCWVRLSFLSGCFGAGAYRRKPLKPRLANNSSNC